MKKVLFLLVFSLLFSLTNAVYSIDQEQTDNAGITLNLSDGWHVRQEFQMGEGGEGGPYGQMFIDEIKKVELWVSQNGTGMVQGKVSIKQGTDTKCWNVFSLDDSNATPHAVIIDLDCNGLIGNVWYELWVETSGTPIGDASLLIHGSDTSTYAGRLFYEDGTPGSPLTTSDLYFKLYYHYVPDTMMSFGGDPQDGWIPNYSPDDFAGDIRTLQIKWEGREVIPKAQSYGIYVKYLGGHTTNDTYPRTNSENENLVAGKQNGISIGPCNYVGQTDPVCVPVVSAYVEQGHDVEIVVPIYQLPKQPLGRWAIRIESCIGTSETSCTWFGEKDVWFPFNLDYAPALNESEDNILIEPGTRLHWNELYHYQIQALKSMSKVTHYILKLEGQTPGTICNSNPLPDYCYIPLNLKNANYACTSPSPIDDACKNYFEFDQTSINSIPAGTYNWSLTIFAAKQDLYTSNGKPTLYKKVQLKKLKFGEENTFIIPSRGGGAVIRDPQAVPSQGTPVQPINGGFATP
ncbi:MAG: hypothetical protein ABH803_01705 [Candidatus Micrarchaeota archaeon]